MRWTALPLTALMLALSLATPSKAQVDPNQPPPGVQIMQQLQENMNNAGVTPQDLVQQLRDQYQQTGTVDMQGFVQNLQQQGIVTQDMLDRAQQMRNQFQQQRGQVNINQLQQLLNSPADEWAIIGPKVQRVMDLSSQLKDPSPFTNQQQQQQRNFGGNQPTPTPTPTPTPLVAALSELKAMLQNPEATDNDIHAKLTVYRDARQRVQADLQSARLDLLALLTLRQEGILLAMDIMN